MKKLPIGIQSFRNLRNEDYLYVDKTEDVLRMIDSGRVYILSRPRRFGKSLLVSTLDELFSGNRPLFEGLYIHDRWDWTQPYPVIRLDWGNVNHATSEEMEYDMADALDEMARDRQITLNRRYAAGKFGELIRQLYRQTGRQVVVLVDEYDMPILDALDKSPEEIKKIRDFLNTFYKVLKSSDDCLRFIFLTGISKFSGVSIFSALNNPRDITMDGRYASICGYTQEELESYFPEYLDETGRRMSMSRDDLLKEIRRWYNGYSWDGETTVYNPFSTLLFFDSRQFGNYWFRSGTPTFLINLLKKRNNLNPVLEPVLADDSLFNCFDPLRIGETPLLFQSGYLTVKSMESTGGRPQYTLGIPNMEVRESLLKYLLSAYSGYPAEEMQGMRSEMQRQILSGDASGLERNLRTLLAGIPYQLHVESEAYYHSLLLVWLKTLDFDIRGEVSVSAGRIDAVWRQAEQTVVVEVKYHAQKNADSLLNEALSQIRDRRYCEAYLDGKVRLLAIAFSGKEIACRMEELDQQEGEP